MNVPNITLIIQAIHFLVAYLVLRKLIFTPALQILNKQEIDLHKLQQSIDDISLQKDQATNKMHARWSSIKQSLNGLIPSLAIKYFKITKIDSKDFLQKSVELLSDNQKNKLKKTITQRLSEVKS